MLFLLLMLGFGGYLYNPGDTISVSGHVDSVYLIRGQRGSARILVVSLRSEKEKVSNVILGPSWFVEFVPAEGDSINVTGARCTNRKGFIVAREIYNISRNKRLVLRTENGFPLWHRNRVRNYGWEDGGEMHHGGESGPMEGTSEQGGRRKRGKH